MTVVKTQPSTAAMLSRLRTTGLPVGDGRKPKDAGWQGAEGESVFQTYLVLYAILVTRAGPDASLADRHDAPVLRYQVTAVGQDRRAAETAMDLASAALLNGLPLDIPGRATVLLISESSFPVDADESVSPPVFTAAERFRLDTSS